jgi:hypothetical protein
MSGETIVASPMFGRTGAPCAHVEGNGQFKSDDDSEHDADSQQGTFLGAMRTTYLAVKVEIDGERLCATFVLLYTHKPYLALL